MQLTTSELEQSMYTLEMCVATLMQKAMAEPMMDAPHTMVYSDLLSSTAKMRTELVSRGVVLELPMYLLATEQPIQMSA